MKILLIAGGAAGAFFASRYGIKRFKMYLRSDAMSFYEGAHQLVYYPDPSEAANS